MIFQTVHNILETGCFSPQVERFLLKDSDKHFVTDVADFLPIFLTELRNRCRFKTYVLFKILDDVQIPETQLP
jgi:hypothetical protein